jgi:hypothetical protein
MLPFGSAMNFPPSFAEAQWENLMGLGRCNIIEIREAIV